jgi:SAM-dependent methyltransferase
MSALQSNTSVMSHPQKRARLTLRLQCPRCSSALGPLPEIGPLVDSQLTCPTCLLEIRSDHGIWKALPVSRQSYYERFISEYQIVRAAEGRESNDATFYLALPYRDLSGHNQHQWAIRASSFRYIEQKILSALETKRPGGMNILDLGAGNGWMSYRLALRGHDPVAVDLLTNDADGLGAAMHYRIVLDSLFPRFQAELDRLPFADSQFDCAIFNASFHYSEDYERTLAETIRCVRSGGSVIVSDTAWYHNEESGRQMLAERRAAFTARFGFPSDGLTSLEFLTDSRLRNLERRFGFRWHIHRPWYGVRWAARPVIAQLRGHREPSRFRIYVAEISK